MAAISMAAVPVVGTAPQSEQSGDSEDMDGWFHPYKLSGAHRLGGAGEQQFTADELRHAYGMFPSGVTAVCVQGEFGPVGLAASSFTSVSMDPPLVSVCVGETSTTWPRMRNAASLGISVLAESQGPAARALASRAGDKFADLSYESTPGGAVFVHGASLWLECVIEQEVVAGDHEIIVLRVTSLQPYPDSSPMVFHGSKFRQLQP
ncbi:hypothetical protein BH09ACT10_BH09ACT10_16570 [soil metagenome]